MAAWNAALPSFQRFWGSHPNDIEGIAAYVERNANARGTL